MISEKAKIFNGNYDKLKETIRSVISSKSIQESLIRSIACYTEYKLKALDGSNTDSLLEQVNEVYCGIYDILKENKSVSDKINNSISILNEETLDARTNGEAYNIDMNPNGDADGMRHYGGITTHKIQLFGGNGKNNQKYKLRATPNPYFHSTIDYEKVPINSSDKDTSSNNTNKNDNQLEDNNIYKKPINNNNSSKMDDLFRKVGISVNNNNSSGYNIRANTVPGNTNDNNNLIPIRTENNISNSDNYNDDIPDRYYPRIGNEYSFPDPSEKARHIGSQYSLVAGNKPNKTYVGTMSNNDAYAANQPDRIIPYDIKNNIWYGNKNGTNTNNINDNDLTNDTTKNNEPLQVYGIPNKDTNTVYYQPYIKIPTAKENFDYRKVNNKSLKGVEGYDSIDDYVKANIDKDPNIRIVNDTSNKDIQLTKKEQQTPQKTSSSENGAEDKGVQNNA